MMLIFRGKMQSLRNAILAYMRVEVPMKGRWVPQYLNGIHKHEQLMCMCSTAANSSQDEVVDKVIDLVKKFDKINATKKDLSLDSLDRVELVMAFEEEFSVEIPDSEADKLKCCLDVAKYIISNSSEEASESC
ncbi:acyl carrier protein 3, mitochondrial isoform X3 [Andrographis paniculata]|uniref:acyl carrier protein 3, mitochondrial isoform X3 n=1 Tax=Andrographis paniculata TaxID=175694 RepID=UPI0021E9981E|nr:acyl carrier protein 3, mitochondrial isoform X3 [Andrographis paniculata]